MKKRFLFFILGFLLVGGLAPARAEAPHSDWPSLNYDAAQSNDNSAETTLTARNVLKLKVKWTAPIADVSYPVVANGRIYVPIVAGHKIHVQVLDALSGKPLGKIAKDALGGLLVDNGSLYLAGYSLQQIDPTTDQRTAQIAPPATLRGGVFLNPVADQKIILVGYSSSARVPGARLFTIDPTSNQVVRTLPSTDAAGTIDGSGRVFTETTAGSAFYDEASGRTVARPSGLRSKWFVGDTLAYTVASMKRGNAILYAYDGAGHRAWSRTVGPPLGAIDWPHAVSPSAVYVQIFRPQPGIQALNPTNGHVLWTRHIPDISALTLAGGVLYALSYSLGQPVRLIALHAGTGAPIGAIVLSLGYYAFNAINSLMVANGEVFIRAVGPGGSRLVALELAG